MTAPTIEEQINRVNYLLDYFHEDREPELVAILASLEKLQSIESQPVPVEPDCNSYVDSEQGDAAYYRDLHIYIDSLQSALKRAQAERDKCAMMNDDQSRRVYAAEENVKHQAEAIRDLVEAAALVAEANDEDCRYDHDGYCQAHNLDHQLDGCRVAKLHNALAKLKEAE